MEIEVVVWETQSWKFVLRVLRLTLTWYCSEELCGTQNHVNICFDSYLSYRATADADGLFTTFVTAPIAALVG